MSEQMKCKHCGEPIVKRGSDWAHEVYGFHCYAGGTEKRWYPAEPSPEVAPMQIAEEVQVDELVEGIRSEWERMEVGVDTCYTFEGQLGLEILRLRRQLRKVPAVAPRETQPEPFEDTYLNPAYKLACRYTPDDDAETEELAVQISNVIYRWQRTKGGR